MTLYTAYSHRVLLFNYSLMTRYVTNDIYNISHDFDQRLIMNVKNKYLNSFLYASIRRIYAMRL